MNTNVVTRIILVCSVVSFFGSSKIHGQDEFIESQDANAIAWLLEKCSTEKDCTTVRLAEHSFFDSWPVDRLDELQFHREKTVSLPAAWRVMLQNIFAKNRSAGQEVGYFFGFLLGKCDSSFVGDGYHELMRKIYVESDDSSSLRIDDGQKFMSELQFSLKAGGATLEGRYPKMSGMPESKDGFIQRKEGEKVVWKSKIPKTKMAGTMRGSWNVNPKMASVFASRQSVFSLTVFDRSGIYIHEFDLSTGEFIRVYFLEFRITHANVDDKTDKNQSNR